MPHAIKAQQRCPVLSSIWECPPGRLRGEWRSRQPVERVQPRTQFQSCKHIGTTTLLPNQFLLSEQFW